MPSFTKPYRVARNMNKVSRKNAKKSSKKYLLAFISKKSNGFRMFCFSKKKAHLKPHFEFITLSIVVAINDNSIRRLRPKNIIPMLILKGFKRETSFENIDLFPST